MLTCSASIVGQTFAIAEGHALELFTCAPRIRKGAPSTINAWRPSRVTIRGTAVSCAAATGVESVAAAAIAVPMILMRLPFVLLSRGGRPGKKPSRENGWDHAPGAAAA
ncbi:hypothetical protein GCM10009095_15260 [Sphingomonas molluscorum]|nr:hypothetical protein GCM10017606_30200 [Microbacterium terregens]